MAVKPVPPTLQSKRFRNLLIRKFCSITLLENWILRLVSLKSHQNEEKKNGAIFVFENTITFQVIFEETKC